MYVEIYESSSCGENAAGLQLMHHTFSVITPKFARRRHLGWAAQSPKQVVNV